MIFSSGDSNASCVLVKLVFGFTLALAVCTTGIAILGNGGVCILGNLVVCIDVSSVGIEDTGSILGFCVSNFLFLYSFSICFNNFFG